MEEWVLDSEAGDHMCKDESMLVGVKPVGQMHPRYWLGPLEMLRLTLMSMESAVA